MTVALGDPESHLRLVGPLARGSLRHALDRLPIDSAAAFEPLGSSVPTGDPLVLCGALCGTNDLDAAVRMLRGAAGDDGRLVFLEHVRPPGGRRLVHAAAGAVVSRLPGGCRTDHDVPAALRRGGFLITDLERFTMPTPVLALRPWVRGVAVARRERP